MQTAPAPSSWARASPAKSSAATRVEEIKAKAITRAKNKQTGNEQAGGVRTMAGGQGLHIWYQAQFPDFSIGFLMVVLVCVNV